MYWINVIFHLPNHEKAPIILLNTKFGTPPPIQPLMNDKSWDEQWIYVIVSINSICIRPVITDLLNFISFKSLPHWGLEPTNFQLSARQYISWLLWQKLTH